MLNKPWIAAAMMLLSPFIFNPTTAAADEPIAIAEPEGWDYLIPVGSLMGTNMAFWVANRYVLDADYAYISATTMADNFREGFEWDSDLFSINQVGHPYQGGLYHAGARAVGFGFWESLPYTILGSLQWEMFMENNRPSVNDFITTTFGGVALGEALFRLASVVLDDSTTGGGRAAREAGALALSPIFGLSRLVSGAAFEQQAGPPNEPIATRLALGLDEFRPADIDDGVVSLGIDARLVYGTFDDDESNFKPLDWFTLDLGLNSNRRREFYAAQLDITGLLARMNFGCGSGNQCALGPMLHFDYYDSPLFKVSSSAVGASALGQFDLGFWSLNLFTEFDLGWIPLGGFDSPYAIGVGRDYNLGTGAFARAVVELAKPDWFRLRAISSRHYVRTVNGAAGHDFAGITQLELEVPIYGGFGISVGAVGYDREEVPDHFDTVTNSYVAGQTQILWRHP